MTTVFLEDVNGPDFRKIFPLNMIDIFSESLDRKFPGEGLVVKRRLRVEDKDYSIGVYAENAIPDPASYETGRVNNSSAASINRYRIKIASCIRDTVEERGLARHYSFAKLIEQQIETDPALQVASQGLASRDGEHLRKWEIEALYYAQREINRQWVYVSEMQINIEAEKGF